jgi:hypothetical protein
MKKRIFLPGLLLICSCLPGQIDTISTNIYQNNGNMGIGTGYPVSLLSLESNIPSGVIQRNLLKILNLADGTHAYSGIILKTGDNDVQSVIQDYGLGYVASPHYDFAGFLNLANSARGVMIHARGDGIIKFFTGHDEVAGAGIERLRIDSDGNIGIGTKEPVTKLQVADGDVYISDIDRGIIMRSPDGQCWKGVLDNSGTLQFTQVECPDMGTSNPAVQMKSAAEIDIFPNPTDNSITLYVNDDNWKSFKYSIYDLNGKLVENGRFRAQYQDIPVSAYPNAVYVLNVYDKRGNQLASRKFMKK